MKSGKNEVLDRDNYRLTFDSKKQVVWVNEIKEDYPLSYKFFRARIKYKALEEVLQDNWDDIKEDDFITLYTGYEIKEM